MVLRIRLSRFGTRHNPLYNIVLTQARTARDSKPMEVLGTYNPQPQTPLASASTPEFATDPSTGATLIDKKTGEAVLYKEKKFKDIKLDVVRTKYWLGVGAQPSETVERILSMVSFNQGVMCECLAYGMCRLG